MTDASSCETRPRWPANYKLLKINGLWHQAASTESFQNYSPDGPMALGLSKTEVAFAKSLECAAVRGNHVRIDQFGGGDEPRVILA